MPGEATLYSELLVAFALFVCLKIINSRLPEGFTNSPRLFLMNPSDFRKSPPPLEGSSPLWAAQHIPPEDRLAVLGSQGYLTRRFSWLGLRFCCLMGLTSLLWSFYTLAPFTTISDLPMDSYSHGHFFMFTFFVSVANLAGFIYIITDEFGYWQQVYNTYFEKLARTDVWLSLQDRESGDIENYIQFSILRTVFLENVKTHNARELREYLDAHAGRNKVMDVFLFDPRERVVLPLIKERARLADKIAKDYQESREVTDDLPRLEELNQKIEREKEHIYSRGAHEPPELNLDLGAKAPLVGSGWPSLGGLTTSATCGFVTFADVSTAVCMVGQRFSDSDLKMSPCLLNFNEVDYECVCRSWSEARELLGSFIFVGLVILWSVFLNLLRLLFDHLLLGYVDFSGYFIVLVLQGLPRMLYEFSKRVERVSTRRRLDEIVFHRVFILQLCTIYVSSASKAYYSNLTWDAFISLGDATFMEKLAQFLVSLPNAAPYFCLYTLAQSIIWQPIYLLVPLVNFWLVKRDSAFGDLYYGKTINLYGMIPDWKRIPEVFPLNLINHSFVFSIVLSFSMVYPPICWIGALYFMVTRAVQAYLYAYVYTCEGNICTGSHLSSGAVNNSTQPEMATVDGFNVFKNAVDKVFLAYVGQLFCLATFCGGKEAFITAILIICQIPLLWWFYRVFIADRFGSISRLPLDIARRIDEVERLKKSEPYRNLFTSPLRRSKAITMENLVHVARTFMGDTEDPRFINF